MLNDKAGLFAFRFSWMSDRFCPYIVLSSSLFACPSYLFHAFDDLTKEKDKRTNYDKLLH